MRKRLSGLPILGVCVAIIGLIGMCLAQLPAQPTNVEKVTIPVTSDYPRWLHATALAPDGQSQFLTLILPEQKKILVYEIGLADRDGLEKGMLKPKSIRSIQGDIQTESFNEQEPTLHQLEQMLRQGR